MNMTTYMLVCEEDYTLVHCCLKCFLLVYGERKRFEDALIAVLSMKIKSTSAND